MIELPAVTGRRKVRGWCPDVAVPCYRAVVTVVNHGTRERLASLPTVVPLRRRSLKHGLRPSPSPS